MFGLVFGAGTGVLTQSLFDHANPYSSAHTIDHTRKLVSDNLRTAYDGVYHRLNDTGTALHTFKHEQIVFALEFDTRLRVGTYISALPPLLLPL